ncbi:hypothetical protein, partial [Paenibacillus sediminis]
MSSTSHNTIFTLRKSSCLGPAGVRSGFGDEIPVAGKQIQPDTPAPPNRIAAGHFVTLRWWGVVNTTTLYKIKAENPEPKQLRKSKIYKITWPAYQWQP